MSHAFIAVCKIRQPDHHQHIQLLYDKLLEDPELAPFFVDVDIDALREHVEDFLGVVTGGPDIYRGRDIRDAHAAYHITNAHFDRLLTHILAAAHEVGLEEEDTQTLLDIIAATRADVVTR